MPLWIYIVSLAGETSEICYLVCAPDHRSAVDTIRSKYKTKDPLSAVEIGRASDGLLSGLIASFDEYEVKRA